MTQTTNCFCLRNGNAALINLTCNPNTCTKVYRKKMILKRFTKKKKKKLTVLNKKLMQTETADHDQNVKVKK